MRANTAPKLVTPDNLNRTVPVKPRNVKFRKRECETVQKTIPGADLTAFLYQRDGDYCIGMISSRW